MTPDRGDMWVFGYGSLMWNPGFPFVERQQAILHGFHRSLCVYSYVHRGTPERPGLVLGLDRGGSCRGIAFRVAAEEAKAAHAYLTAREQVTSVYVEMWRRVRLLDGRTVAALSYAVDRAHEQYARALPRAQLLHHVRNGVGVSGRNPDYVRATQAHLAGLGIHDATLTWLVGELAEEAEQSSV
ncbi:gamma-glutamylcyclotransferase [Alsobacter sp. R-9]